MAKVTFNNQGAVFFQSIKESVDAYFEKNKLKKTGNMKLYMKAIILMPAAVLLYLFLLFGSYGVVAGILLAAFFGFILVSIAFNIMHDACHGSFSRRKWVNEVMGLTMNALGSNAFIWKMKHNIIHHTYTNVDGVDDDIAKNPMFRLSPTQKRLPLHRFQFLYMFVLYPLTSISWMLVYDFSKYFSRKINNTPINNISRKEHVIFWVSKALYAVFYGLVPILAVGWLPWLVGFLVMHFTMGLMVAIVFQLAHVVEKTSFEIAGEEPKVIDAEWAVHQLKTTADFAPRNKVISWFLGGLNYQVVHHLFPRISHVHYPALHKIIKEQCQKFNQPYNYYNTMTAAIISHIRLLKQLGEKNRFTEYAIQQS